MRRKDREVTDFQTVKYILDSSKVLHLGLSDCGKPYIVPMNYGYKLQDGKLEFYVHSALEGRKIEIIKQNPECCAQLECNTALKEGEIACKYGYSFYSLEGFGKITILSNPSDKIEALKNLMKLQTGKDFDFTNEMVESVLVLRIKCDSFTAKHRQ